MQGQLCQSRAIGPNSDVRLLDMSSVSDVSFVCLHIASLVMWSPVLIKWSKKEAGSLPRSEVECLSREFFIFIFDLKMASFDAFLVVFYAI